MARAGFSERTRMLFERGSATSETRSRASVGAAWLPVSASARFNVLTISSADAFFTGTMIGSPNGG